MSNDCYSTNGRTFCTCPDGTEVFDPESDGKVVCLSTTVVPAKSVDDLRFSNENSEMHYSSSFDVIKRLIEEFLLYLCVIVLVLVLYFILRLYNIFASRFGFSVYNVNRFFTVISQLLDFVPSTIAPIGVLRNLINRSDFLDQVQQYDAALAESVV